MLKKIIIFIAIFVIILLIISRCGSDTPIEQDPFSNVAKNAVNNIDSAVGDVTGLAKGAADNALGTAGNVANNIVSTAEGVAGSVEGGASDVLDSAKNTVNNIGPAVGSATAGSGKETVGNALDANLYKPQTRDTIDSNIDLNSVTFDFNSSELERVFYTTLDAEINKIKSSNNAIEVAGHADNIGSNSVNMKLSRRRADAVIDYLVSKGVDASRLSAKGYGSKYPVADNSTSLGRDANRRVEIHKQ